MPPDHLLWRWSKMAVWLLETNNRLTHLSWCGCLLWQMLHWCWLLLHFGLIILLELKGTTCLVSCARRSCAKPQKRLVPKTTTCCFMWWRIAHQVGSVSTGTSEYRAVYQVVKQYPACMCCHCSVATSGDLAPLYPIPDSWHVWHQFSGVGALFVLEVHNWASEHHPPGSLYSLAQEVCSIQQHLQVVGRYINVLAASKFENWHHIIYTQKGIGYVLNAWIAIVRREWYRSPTLS